MLQIFSRIQTTLEPGVGIRAARPDPIFFIPDRDEPDFFQPDISRKCHPDPDPIGIGPARFIPMFTEKYRIILKFDF